MIDLFSIEGVGLGLADQASREEALDPTRSFLVQAPAGSGKTELLAMRFLKLLAEVEEPGNILAITFTMNATAEIRHRVMLKLEQARLFHASGIVPPGEDRRSIEIAVAALENSARRGWRLLERPQSLNIQSIDALCLRITQQMPLAARLGGAARAKFQWPLYRSAARKTFDRLGGSDAELNTALRALLLLRENNLASCESLLAGMLASRDQWMRAFPLYGEINWLATRAHLEEPFHREIERVLAEAHTLLSSHPELTRELLELANYACGSEELKIEIRLLAGLSSLPAASLDYLDHWQCFCDLLLTEGGQARKAYRGSEGFSKGDANKGRMSTLVRNLSNVPGLIGLLVDIRQLPPLHYSDDQWQSLRHIFTALRQAVSELQAVFVEQNTTDFIEVGMAALQVVEDKAAIPAFVGDIRHLLIDEFQDTSRRQHELVSALLGDWELQPGRTFFLVGDPMQSIYMFRQAEVELFNLVGKQGFATSRDLFPPRTLCLATNFRSNAGVVKPLNAMFAKVFPHGARESAAAVDFLPGVPGNLDEPTGAYEVHASFLQATNDADETASPYGIEITPAAAAQQAETDRVLEILRRHLPRLARARAHGEEFTVAVLGRAKKHLAQIASALRNERIPFRAVELEKLWERPEVLDLQALTFALLHPRDRVAWLAVLRAPWCGLAISDLHVLCGADHNAFARDAVLGQIEARLAQVSDEARERVERVLGVMQNALRSRYQQSSFSSWIERTWTSLGGPSCVDATGYENAYAYFRMLDGVALDGIGATGEALTEQLDRLFASADPAVDERCGIQLMTIHKAKGLGFNVVLLPGLHRRTKSYTPVLIQYLERATGTGTELLVAPIDSSTEDTSPLHRWVRQQKENRETEERKRLLYVACTRAREELHLFATAAVKNESPRCTEGTLLHTGWPALQETFAAKYAAVAASRQTEAANLLAMPAPAPSGESSPLVLDKVAAARSKTMLRRLPLRSREAPAENVVMDTAAYTQRPLPSPPDRNRPDASRTSRTLGTTVHALFEKAALLLAGSVTLPELRGDLPAFQRYAVGLARNEGLAPAETEACVKAALAALSSALADEVGAWILEPHPGAATESSWTGMINGQARTLRIDRSFMAGPEPLSTGKECLWIVDYKTATHSKSGLEEFLETEKRQYADQLESYGRMMRLAHGDALQLRLGLYYPLLRRLLWWQPGPA